MMFSLQDLKKKIEAVIDEDVPLSKRRKESSPRSSQPSSPSTRYTLLTLKNPFSKHSPIPMIYSVAEKGKRKTSEAANPAPTSLASADEMVVDLSAGKRFKDSPRSSQPSSPAGRYKKETRKQRNLHLPLDITSVQCHITALI